MINELGGIWKEATVAYSRHYTKTSLEELSKTTKASVRIADAHSKLGPNTSRIQVQSGIAKSACSVIAVGKSLRMKTILFRTFS
jgi:hypothetical protein